MQYKVQTASSQTIKILLLYNVDINLQDNDGWTPLHLAVQTQRTDLVRLLLIKGADKTNHLSINKQGFCSFGKTNHLSINKLVKVSMEKLHDVLPHMISEDIKAISAFTLQNLVWL